MARTFRGNGKPDGKAQTMKGLDRCPPRAFRRTTCIVPARRYNTAYARLARLIDSLELPVAYVKVRKPYYT